MKKLISSLLVCCLLLCLLPAASAAANASYPTTKSFISWLEANDVVYDYNGVDEGVVKFDDSLAFSWAVIPHYSRPFYVFQYATGMVAAGALVDAVLTEGEPARDRYLRLLSSGGSKFPLDLLRDAGIDMSRPDPILAALHQFDSLVAEMEEIYENLPEEARRATSR